jgi:hypothetical protein
VNQTQGTAVAVGNHLPAGPDWLTSAPPKSKNLRSPLVTDPLIIRTNNITILL